MSEDKNKLTLFNYIPFFLLIVWSLTFYEGLVTAAKIWYISEIFHHCAFVIPGVAYLIYRKRHVFHSHSIQPNNWFLIPILGCSILYALGVAGDIQLFMHIATFSILPFVFTTLTGYKIAKELAFPLFFVLFAIPIGEEIVPQLQQIAADASVFLLKLSGVPIYRSGLYIEIPQGQFLVAEACSGISFFIASIVIGSLYIHLNIASTAKKIIFLSISIGLPILANAVRVYGIILTAYLTDMKYAAGADHLIYGGVFFSFVIICLLLIGELFRDEKKIEVVSEKKKTKLKFQSFGFFAPTLILCIFLVTLAWVNIINRGLEGEAKTSLIQPDLFSEMLFSKYEPTHRWRPKFDSASDTAFFVKSNSSIELYVAWFPAGHGELISSLNKPYVQEDWTIVSKEVLQSPIKINTEVITSTSGRKRAIAYWYVIEDQSFSSKAKAKLYQTLRAMKGEGSNGIYVALSTELNSGNLERDLEIFIQRLPEVHKKIHQSLTDFVAAK